MALAIETFKSRWGVGLRYGAQCTGRFGSFHLPEHWERVNELLERDGITFSGADARLSEHQGPHAHCFFNAVKAPRWDRLHYCEGFITERTGTLRETQTHHAWCVAPETGRVVEPVAPIGDTYVGVVFPLAEAVRLQRRVKCLSVLGTLRCVRTC